MDEDGTEVDEDDVLLEIGKGSQAACLMLLADEQLWKSVSSTPVEGALETQNEGDYLYDKIDHIYLFSLYAVYECVSLGYRSIEFGSNIKCHGFGSNSVG